MQTTEKIVSTAAERQLIIYMIVVLIILSALIILFFVVYQRRKNQLLIKNISQQKQFDEELIKTQQEIQEETLRYIGRELHDNIGQRLVLATMQMTVASKLVKDEVKSKVENAAKSLKDTLEEVRAISRSLNSDIITNLGFDATVRNEVARLNKSGLIESQITVIGDKVDFENNKDEIILFRILQEFFSNTLKYAEAENLELILEYRDKNLVISVKDDGVGFDFETIKEGSGLINMKKRAELLDAEFYLQSKLEGGTSFKLTYPYKSL